MCANTPHSTRTRKTTDEHAAPTSRQQASRGHTARSASHFRTGRMRPMREQLRQADRAGPNTTDERTHLQRLQAPVVTVVWDTPQTGNAHTHTVFERRAGGQPHINNNNNTHCNLNMAQAASTQTHTLSKQTSTHTNTTVPAACALRAAARR